MKWKKIPERMMVAVHKCGKEFSMTKVDVDYVRQHYEVPKESPIRSDWLGRVIEVKMACGCTRWFGVEKTRKVYSSYGEKLIVLPASEKSAMSGWEDVSR